MSVPTPCMTWREPMRTTTGAVSVAPVHMLPTYQCVTYALAWQAFAFAWLTAQFFLMCAFGPAAILPSLIALPLLLRHRPLAGITVFLQVLLYQNLFLSIVSGFGIDPGSVPGRTRSLIRGSLWHGGVFDHALASGRSGRRPRRPPGTVLFAYRSPSPSSTPCTG